MTNRDANPEELCSLRRMSGLSVAALAARAGPPGPNTSPRWRRARRQCSRKIYDRVFNAVDDVISEMDDPGPLW